ncbi:MAG: glycerol-3-phosphate 1-O-acyltransferase PlsY [Salinivirgaceae bacterium]|jgi:glycerol-3-phosphate acyltransferase PlsY|nr:glycerol-3-phosphate 1-O-acyltransferase PlsY [Salinivirgaceae bacterium]
MGVLLTLVILALTYVWGSIPSGYILTKFYTGDNILELGSGNVGSTNVKRVAGKKVAVYTQLADMFKGILPVGICLYIGAYTDIALISPYYVYALAIAAIIGHNNSCFLKFKGGKGVNTTLGASVLLAPYSVFISVAIYYLVKWRFKYVSLGSLAIGIFMPLIEVIIHGITPTFFYLLICSIMIFVRHRANIKRLIYNEELS